MTNESKEDFKTIVRGLQETVELLNDGKLKDFDLALTIYAASKALTSLVGKENSELIERVESTFRGLLKILN